MTFLHPALLMAGLAAVLIPIVIHFLFRRRRKPVMWGAMRFLVEAYRRQRRRLQLEQLVLLALRCLLIACVAAALGRPVLEAAGLLGPGGGAQVVFVVLDNSLASQVRGSDGEVALDRHKAQALEVLDALGPGARAGLVTLGAPVDGVVVPASSDVGAVRRLVEEVEAVDSRADLSGALRVISGALAGVRGEDRVRVVVLSEFREGSVAMSDPLPAVLAGGGVSIVAPGPSAEGIDNVRAVAVDPVRSVIVAGGGGDASSQQVRVRLRRSGPSVGQAAVSSVLVRIVGADGGALDAAGTRVPVRWEPGAEEAEATVQVRAAAVEGRRGGMVVMASVDQDPLVSDNIVRSAVGVRDVLRIGVIGQRRFGGGPGVGEMTPGDWLRLALSPGDGGGIEVVDIEAAAVDAPTLSGVDAVFVPGPEVLGDSVWGRLRGFADAGGLVVVMPPVQVGASVWAESFTGAFGLDWRIAGEPVEFEDEPARVERAGSADGVEGAAGGLLAVIGGEVEDLLRAVGVYRAAPVVEWDASASDVVLGLAGGGGAWLIAGRVGAGGSGEGVGAGEESARGAELRAGRGLVVYIASAMSLEWTDVPAKPLMVPLVQEVVRQGIGRAGGAGSWIAGGEMGVPAGAVRLAGTGDGADIGVSASGEPEHPMRTDGVWDAVDEAGRSRGLVVVNADQAGGATGVSSEAAVREWLAGALREEGGAEGASGGVTMFGEGGVSAAFAEGEEGSPVSVPLLLGALAVALVETVAARRFSHVDSVGTSAGRAAPAGASAA